jgi:hypothetical protein
LTLTAGKLFNRGARHNLSNMAKTSKPFSVGQNLFQICASVAAIVLMGSTAGAASEAKTSIATVTQLPTARTNSFYISNRAPLAPSPLVKLPIGAITPKGWLRNQLELERDGMIGHLKEISPWLNFEKSAWGNKNGEGERGWEELPYWLKGYGDLGYVLRDAQITAEARKWIDAAMSSQREDGYFGPRALLTGLKGKADLWPHMVMLNILQSYHEHTGDPRVLDVMTRYFKWEDQLPASAFGEGYWPKIRAGDNIESLYWLYNRGGEPWLLDLAKKIHDNMARWDEDVINWHNVNIAQGFRAGTVFWMQSKNPKHLASAEGNYQKVRDMYGQFPGGMFAGDENCRPGFTDPRQGFETCGMVEFMHSFEMLTKIYGDPVWADRCEEQAFNSLPASMTPDQKGLHYLTCANQVQLDRNNKAPAIENGGTMFSYSPFEVYRCCQHNVSHGWPYYAEELWLATADDGLCASLYAASEVNAVVANKTPIKVVEETDYPFEDTIRFKLSVPKRIEFPLYLRIPAWSGAPVVSVNGNKTKVQNVPHSFIRIEREWQDGDTITVQFPMRVSVRTWPKNKNAVSVDYGPLTLALKIKERWQRYGKNEKWPEWEVFPESSWNYGLVLDEKRPENSFRVVRKKGSLPKQPFTPENAPIELKAKAKRIPQWQQDRFAMVGLLQQSPVRSDEPTETVTLIPMGAARLRIASFPVIGTGPNAHEWTPPPRASKPKFKATASHVFQNDTVDALSDGLEPANSNDQSIPRFTWWPRRGTSEWVEADLEQPRKVSGVSVYWFDDTGAGACRVPQSWRLLYKSGSEWKAVAGTSISAVTKDGWNSVKFPAVETSALRIETQLQPEFSGGILEWKINE